MPFTSNCDLFGSLNEEGINRLINHAMRQRPSLFNYGTAFVAAHPELLCERIETIPDVRARGNPLITIEDPIALPGSNGAYGFNFCFQLTRLQLDFHPGSAITLPPELRPLPAQQFALHVRVCGGLGCPSNDNIRGLDIPQPVGERDKERKQRDERPRLPPVPFPTNKLECFCLDLFATGHFEIVGTSPHQKLVGKLDGLEVVDITPTGMENNAECYIRTLIQLVILPRLGVELEKFIFQLLHGMLKIKLKPTPISAAVPHNPAIEDNQLKVFINMEVS